MTEKFLSTTQAAQILNVGVRLVAKWCAEGLLPAVKVGKTWVINEKDLANHPPVGEWQGTHSRRKPKTP